MSTKNKFFEHSNIWRLWNTKGDFLTDNMLSVIIAVIGIGLLAVLAFTLYNAVTNTEEKDAQNLLENIVEKMGRIDDEGGFSVQGVYTKDDSKEWKFVQWNKDYYYTPAKCYPESCICICKMDKVTSGSIFDFFTIRTGQEIVDEIDERYSNACQSRAGFCERVDYELVGGFASAMAPQIIEFDVKKEDGKLCLAPIKGGQPSHKECPDSLK